MLRFPKLVYNNKFSLPSLPPPGTFDGQTILITGGSTGIGLATAVHFVNLGASLVIITARSIENGEAAKISIIAQTSCSEGVIKVMKLDMSTFAGTRDFAEQIKSTLKNIDYVLLNAGTLNTKFALGKEGYEETNQVNALSTGLLGLLLLPWIKEAGRGKAHMAFVTSGLHRFLNISESKWPQKDVFEYFNQKENWPSGGMYATSKLLEQYIVIEIAKLACGSDGIPQVMVNPLCPGMVKSDLARDYRINSIASFGVDMFMNVVSKSTNGGARTPVLAALTTPEENGKYITFYQGDADYELAVKHNILGEEGQKMQAQVWREAVLIMSTHVPEVLAIANLNAV